EDRDLAGVGRDDVVDHAQRRRLAGAVRAEDAVDDAARDRERDPVDGDVVAEALDDALDDERRRGHAASPTTQRSSTAMRMATPQLTCCRITARGPSAICGDTS